MDIHKILRLTQADDKYIMFAAHVSNEAIKDVVDEYDVTIDQLIEFSDNFLLFMKKDNGYVVNGTIADWYALDYADNNLTQALYNIICNPNFPPEYVVNIVSADGNDHFAVYYEDTDLFMEKVFNAYPFDLTLEIDEDNYLHML